MAGVTDVIIFFVGLTMWSEQLPNDCGVKAILPRVHTMPNTAAMLTRHVEDHVAAIVFPAENYDWQEEWVEPSTLGSGTAAPIAPGTTPSERVFKYVVLDSDPLRFVTNGATNVPAGLSGVTLPPLQELCPAMQRLRAGYEPPYGGAAAVVVLPQGTLKTCLSMPAGSEGRLDTRLDLKTAGDFVISASTMSKPKKLHLKSIDGRPIEIMIANVPAHYFEGVPTTRSRDAIDGMSHENVYFAMCEPGNSNCMSLRDWWNQLQYPDGISLCDSRAFAVPETVVPGTFASLATAAANFECSNSRWP